MTRSQAWSAVLAAILVPALVAAAPVRALANPCLATTAFGLDAGGLPRVKAYFFFPLADFLAFDPSFTGGVRVAVGDIDGDGTAEIIVGAGPGGGPHVKVFKLGVAFDPATGQVPVTEVASFYAFDPGFTGGVYVTAGNFDPSNDPNNAPLVPDALDCAPGGMAILRRDEIVVAAGPGGGPNVKIFRNRTTGPSSNTAIDIDVANPLMSFFAFDASFAGGVRVAAEDLNNDGFDELVVGAGPGARRTSRSSATSPPGRRSAVSTWPTPPGASSRSTRTSPAACTSPRSTGTSTAASMWRSGPARAGDPT